MNQHPSKKINEVKKLEEYTQSRPTQLELFSELYQDHEGYSNTVELYDVMPKYFFGGVTRIDGKYLDNLHREFQCRDKEYKLTITPASLTMKDGSTKHYYPSQREELVEDVIRKFSNRLGIYLDERDAAVKTTYYEIQQELKKRGHGYNIAEIKQAIEVCKRTTIEATSKDGNEVSISSPIFPLVGKENKSDIKEGRNKLVIMLHPLVTKSINEGTYRAINYEKVMSYKMSLSRWLHKKISHYYTQLGREKPYPINLSTIIRDSGMKQYEKISHNISQVKKTLDEMIESHTLVKYEIKKIPEEGKKILDAKFLLHPSNSFISEVKKANHISNLQLEKSRTDEDGLILIVNSEELKNLREEMEKKIYSLSKTVINNHLPKIKTQEDYKNSINALSAARSYIEKKASSGLKFNAAAATIKALKENWILQENDKEQAQKDLFNGDIAKIQTKDNYSEPSVEQVKTWSKLQKTLKENFGEEIYNKWLINLSLYSIKDNIVTISASSKFLRDWIKREYLNIGGTDGKGLRGAFLREMPEIQNVKIIYVVSA